MSFASEISVLFKGNSSDGVRASNQMRESIGRTRREAHSAGVTFGHTGREAKQLERGVLAGSGAFSHLGRSIAFASGAFLGAAGFLQVVRSSISEASDLSTQITRTRVEFAHSGNEVLKWSKTTTAGLGMARSESLKTAASFGTILRGLGFLPAQAAKASIGLTTLAANLSILHGGTTDEAAAAISGALTGRGQALKRYGIVLDTVTLKAEAMRLGLLKTSRDSAKVGLAQDRLAIATARYNKALADYGPTSTQAHSAADSVTTAHMALAKAEAGTTEKMNAAAKAQAAYSLIQRGGKNAADAIAKSHKGLTFQTRVFHAEIKELEGTLGQTLIPVLLNALKPLNRWLASLQEGGRRHKAFKQTLEKVIDTIKTAIGILKKAWDALKKLSDLVGGFQNLMYIAFGAYIAIKLGKFIFWIGKVGAAFRLLLISIGLIAPATTTAVAEADAQLALFDAAAASSTAEVGVLRAALISLGSAAVLAPLAVAAGAVAAIFATKGDQGKVGNLGSYSRSSSHPIVKALSQSNAAFKNKRFIAESTAYTEGKITADQYERWLEMNPGTYKESKGAQRAYRNVRDRPTTAGQGTQGSHYGGHPVPTVTGRKVLWTGNVAGLDGGFKTKLENCVAAAGGNHIDVYSGKRSDATHPGGPPNHGAANSNHLTGHAADGHCWIGGREYQLGDAPMNYAKFGLRAGRTFDWGGGPDLEHVDDNSNHGSSSLASSGSTTSSSGGGKGPGLHVGSKKSTRKASSADTQLAAIAASPWDAGHYGGHGQNLRGAFKRVVAGKANLSANKMKFVQLVSSGTGLDFKVVEAWVVAENGPDDNPLNIGPGKHFGTVEKAAEATIALIEGSHYYGGIRATAGSRSSAGTPANTSAATRYREEQAIRADEAKIRAAVKAGTISKKQGDAAIKKLEVQRKRLVREHEITPTENAKIENSVKKTWTKIDAAIRAGVKAAAKHAAELKKAHEKAVTDAERVVEKARQKFQNAWGRMVDFALTAFDRLTQKGTDAINSTFDALTPSEQRLKDMQTSATGRDLASNLSDAQGQLDYAKMVGDPQMIKDAMRAVQDAQDAQAEEGLTRQADIERAAREKERDAAIQDWQDKREIQRQGLEDYLNDLETKIEEGTIAWQDGMTSAKAAITKNIGDFADLGSQIGSVFVAGLIDSLSGVDGVESAGNAISAGLAKLRGLGWQWDAAAGEWVVVPTGKPPLIGTGGLASAAHQGGLRTPQMALGGIVRKPTLAWVGEKGPEAVIPLSKLGNLGGSMNVTVVMPNYLGDKREAVREILTEMQRQARRGSGGLGLG